MNEEVTVDNVVEKLANKLSEYIETIPTDKLNVLIDVCKGGSDHWFENAIAELVETFAENVLQKRNIGNV
jgi:hypothetical protein